MTIAPDFVVYGSAAVDATGTLGGSTRIIVYVGQTTAVSPIPYGDADFSGQTLSFFVSRVLSGSNPNNDAKAFVLIDDAADPAGDFVESDLTTRRPGVRAIYTHGTGVITGTHVFGDGSGSNPGLNVPITGAGTMRLVVAIGDSIENALRISNVNTGVTNQYHFDSDGNDARGTTANTNGPEGEVTAMVRRQATVASLTTGDNLAWPDLDTIDVDLTDPEGTNDFINPKDVRLALSTDAVGATRSKTIDVTIDATGDAAVQFRADAEFPAASTDHYAQVGVNDTLGNSTTPTAQQPHVLGIAGVDYGSLGLTTAQRSWVTFAAATAPLTLIDEDQARDAGAVTVDPRLAAAITPDEPDTTVYNRGETISGDLTVTNARAEGVSPVGTVTITTVDVGTAAVEDTIGHTEASGVYAYSGNFATAGNVAPADATGAQKALRWRDSTTNAPEPNDTNVGFLSSLLDVVIHLQNNDNTLDPALLTTQRLTSDLGFYSIRILNQRGQGKNGVSVTDHLRDDADLVAAIDRTDTTATVNANVGWLPLATWDSALPGGGWDHWTNSGSFEGNTFEKTRSGAGTNDLVLLAKNPNLTVIPGAGTVAGAHGDHWHPGQDLLIGLAVFDINNDTTVLVDVDGSTPRAGAVVARFNTTLGRAEYLAADRQTWTAITGGIAVEHQLAASPGDPRAYIVTFDAADTATWDHADLFIVGIAFIDSTPYGMQNQIPVLDTRHPHDTDDSAYSLAAHNHDADYADIAHAHALDDLSDVNVAAAVDGEGIVLDTGVWIPGATGGGSEVPGGRLS